MRTKNMSIQVSFDIRVNARFRERERKISQAGYELPETAMSMTTDSKF